jgi:hypothetical protein
MKNVLIVDGADNCEYAIFAMTEAEFAVVFPGEGQNVEFIEDLADRIDEAGCAKLFPPIWKREVKKPDVRGIHGTLFYQLAYKKKYYPTKNDREMVP